MALPSQPSHPRVRDPFVLNNDPKSRERPIVCLSRLRKIVSTVKKSHTPAGPSPERAGTSAGGVQAAQVGPAAAGAQDPPHRRLTDLVAEAGQLAVPGSRPRPGSPRQRPRAGSACRLHAVRTPSPRAAAALALMAGRCSTLAHARPALPGISPGRSSKAPGMPSDGRAPCPSAQPAARHDRHRAGRGRRGHSRRAARVLVAPAVSGPAGLRAPGHAAVPKSAVAGSCGGWNKTEPQPGSRQWIIRLPLPRVPRHQSMTISS